MTLKMDDYNKCTKVKNTFKYSPVEKITRNDGNRSEGKGKESINQE